MLCPGEGSFESFTSRANRSRQLPTCNGPEAGSYLRLIDFVYQSTLTLIVLKKKKKGPYKSIENQLR